MILLLPPVALLAVGVLVVLPEDTVEMLVAWVVVRDVAVLGVDVDAVVVAVPDRAVVVLVVVAVVVVVLAVVLLAGGAGFGGGVVGVVLDSTSMPNTVHSFSSTVKARNRNPRSTFPTREKT